MLIGQISDCHLSSSGGLVYGRVDTAEFLVRAVEAIRALPQCPEFIVATGDLANTGATEEYSLLRKLTYPLGIPVYPVAGNHDNRKALATAFSLEIEAALQPGFIQYVIRDHRLTIIVLDSSTPGSPEPSLCNERLAWLGSRLEEVSGPVLIAMHHPPFVAGVAWMEPKVANWADPFATVVAKHPGKIVGLICGHLHRFVVTSWAGIPAMSAPSIAHQVFPDFTTDARPRFNLEAPGFVLHRWTNGRLASYGIAIPGISDTIEFLQ